MVLIVDSILLNLEPRDNICEKSWLKDVKASEMGVAMFVTACAVVSIDIEGWIYVMAPMVDSMFL
jgi:hypothetical protein